MTATGVSIPRPLLAALCCLCITIPYLSTTYPPVTDLPQHSAQIRLFLEAIEAPESSPYRIQWYTPYSLSYLIIGACWAVVGPENAGRAAMLIIALFWVMMVHALAWHRQRSPACAVVASVLVFNHTFYWGFYSFALGAPIFLIWFMVTTGWTASRPSVKHGLLLFVLGLLLYMSHVLWFLAGAAWLGVVTLAQRPRAQVWLYRLGVILPVVAVIMVWYPVLAGSPMATPPIWLLQPWERILSYSWLTDAAFGGIRGSAEPAALGILLAWVALGAILGRRVLRNEVDREMLLAAGLFLIMALVLPYKFMNTVKLGERWVAPCMVMLLVGMPAPALRPVLRQAVALVFVAAFSAVTTLTWLAFERKDLSGLQEALQALPPKPALLGLSLPRQSDLIKGYPFIQIFAYSQVLKGGRLNFSFAEFAPCLVVYKKPFRSPWSNGMEWYPDRVVESDLQYFDYVLVNGPDKVHGLTARQQKLKPVTHSGRWRLYRVIKPQKRGEG